MKDIHRLASLGVHLSNSKDGGVFVYPVSESSLVVKIKENKILDPNLMKIKSEIPQVLYPCRILLVLD